MQRLLSPLPLLLALLGLLLVPAVRAFAASNAERDAYRKVIGQLKKVTYSELDPDERDELFQKLGGYDDPSAIEGLDDVLGRYGAYLMDLEAQMGSVQNKLAKLMAHPPKSDLERDIRQKLTWDAGDLERKWVRCQKSLDVLTHVLESYRSESTILRAVRTLPKEETWWVRYVFAGACGTWNDRLKDANLSRQLFNALSKLAKDDMPMVRQAVAGSLGSFQSPRALALLLQELKDTDWRVRLAAVHGLARQKTPEAVDALINQFASEKGRLREDINASLQKITGLNLRYADVWKDWWEAQGHRLPTKKEQQLVQPKAKKPKATRPDQTFYGIPTLSNQICFVIDVSGSMNTPVDPLKNKPPAITGVKHDNGPKSAPGKTRLEVAQNELRRAVANLAPTQSFTIIFFNHEVTVWRPQAVKATPENKRDAFRAIGAVKASGATYTLGALREAFAIAGALPGTGTTAKEGPTIDTIFLLSDGMPTDSSYDSPQIMDFHIILDAVRGWNKKQHIKINTIAVDVLDNTFLRTLASDSGGMFVERKG